MPDDDSESLVLPPRDYSKIVKLREPNLIDEFVDNPTAFLELALGAATVGKKGLILSVGRFAVGVLQQRMYETLADELKRLRDAGKLPSSFDAAKNGLHTFAELLAIIDDDPPDADRLEALKAAFYGVNKINATDAERITAYHLWQITKQLKSGELLVLKALKDLDGSLDGVSDQQWIDTVGRSSGLQIQDLVALGLAKLREFRLVTEPPMITRQKCAITNSGRQLCRNIQTYKIDLHAAGGSESE
jgi:hypothetical protein